MIPLDGPQLALLVLLGIATSVAMVLSALLERSGHIRLKHWSENAGARLKELYSRRRRFEAFRFVLATAARFLPVLFVIAAWGVQESRPWVIALVIAGLILALELWSRHLVRRHAERALLLLTIVYRGLFLLTWPFLVLLAPVVGGRRDEANGQNGDDEEDDEASDGEIEAFIDVGRREGILEPEEEVLVRSVVDFGDTQVRSIMTPRVEIQSAPADVGAEELAERFFSSKNSRLPIYRDSIDHVEGVLHIRDLFEAVQNGTDNFDVLKLAQKPHYVPENKALPDLLTELQKLRQQMAIVVDEYGGVAGLVTIEDLVEEIVGEIHDEHEDEMAAESLTGGGWLLAGRTHLEDFEELAGIDLDADDLPYETLSGLICGELGHVPKVGECLEWRDLKMWVEEADERRVMRVSVKPTPADSGPTAAT
ncbi:MAG: hemolysin family protein [Acidobacteriota bacterium]